MTGGQQLAAIGLLLLTRIGADTSYVADVLPAVVVFGIGLSMTVAPLTATVLASADVRHAGVASGVNNAIARAAGLLAVAGLPARSGSAASAAHDRPRSTATSRTPCSSAPRCWCGLGAIGDPVQQRRARARPADGRWPSRSAG